MTYPDLEIERDSEALPASYTTFLLRCWQEQTNGEPAWRFTLVRLGDKGSMHGFASLEALTAHLRLALAERARPPERTEFRSQQKQGDPK